VCLFPARTFPWSSTSPARNSPGIFVIHCVNQCPSWNFPGFFTSPARTIYTNSLCYLFPYRIIPWSFPTPARKFAHNLCVVPVPTQEIYGMFPLIIPENSEDFARSSLLYCILLYYIVLYCIVLYCIVLFVIVLYCTVSYCILSYSIVPYCLVQNSTAQYNTIRSDIIQKDTVQYNTIQYNTMQ